MLSASGASPDSAATCPTAPSQTLTIPLLYQGVVPNIQGYTTSVWRSACTALRLTTANWADGAGTHCYESVLWELACASSSFSPTTVITEIYFRAAADCANLTAGHFVTFGPSSLSYTCSPLRLSWSGGLFVVTP